jgi:hypothetical protein
MKSSKAKMKSCNPKFKTDLQVRGLDTHRNLAFQISILHFALFTLRFRCAAEGGKSRDFSLDVRASEE